MDTGPKKSISTGVKGRGKATLQGIDNLRAWVSLPEETQIGKKREGVGKDAPNDQKRSWQPSGKKKH